MNSVIDPIMSPTKAAKRLQCSRLARWWAITSAKSDGIGVDEFLANRRAFYMLGPRIVPRGDAGVLLLAIFAYLAAFSVNIVNWIDILHEQMATPPQHLVSFWSDWPATGTWLPGLFIGSAASGFAAFIARSLKVARRGRESLPFQFRKILVPELGHTALALILGTNLFALRLGGTAAAHSLFLLRPDWTLVAGVFMASVVLIWVSDAAALGVERRRDGELQCRRNQLEIELGPIAQSADDHKAEHVFGRSFARELSDALARDQAAWLDHAD